MKVYIITDDGGYRYGEAFKDKEKAIKHMIGVIRVMYDIYDDITDDWLIDYIKKHEYYSNLFLETLEVIE